MSDLTLPSALSNGVIDIAKRAGAAIMEVYNGEVEVFTKSDASPLTVADLRAHEIIVTGLTSLSPQVVPRWPVLSEESVATTFAIRSQWQTYWLVDPLDGTKEFVARNGEFTVNIALIHNHVPVLGVVFVPAKALTYVGTANGAYKQVDDHAFVALRVTDRAQTPVRMVGSRSHHSDLPASYLEGLGAHAIVAMGSALKFCVVAEGGADLYPRLGPTSEWDTAAAQAVVEAAGGVVCTLDGQRLLYNTKAELTNPPFVVYGDHSRNWLNGLPKPQ
jgi:3'(2'), 5'-bisphosphate nucleotidase